MGERYPIKLVRDEIENVPNLVGSEVRIWAVGQTTHIELLKAKLLEEVGEYLIGGGAEELADILEVVETLARVAEGWGPDQLRKAKVRKLRERGGFFGASVMYAEATEPRQDGTEGAGS